MYHANSTVNFIISLKWPIFPRGLNDSGALPRLPPSVIQHICYPFYIYKCHIKSSSKKLSRIFLSVIRCFFCCCFFCILFSSQCLQMCPSASLSLLRPILKMTHLFRSRWVDKRHRAKWWWHRGQLPWGFPPQVSTPVQANGDRWWTMPI